MKIYKKEVSVNKTVYVVQVGRRTHWEDSETFEDFNEAVDAYERFSDCSLDARLIIRNETTVRRQQRHVGGEYDDD